MQSVETKQWPRHPRCSRRSATRVIRHSAVVDRDSRTGASTPGSSGTASSDRRDARSRPARSGRFRTGRRARRQLRVEVRERQLVAVGRVGDEPALVGIGCVDVMKEQRDGAHQCCHLRDQGDRRSGIAGLRRARRPPASSAVVRQPRLAPDGRAAALRVDRLHVLAAASAVSVRPIASRFSTTARC